MSSYSRIQLEAWLKTINPVGNVVDIGGSQNPIKGRTNSWEVGEYRIIDLENPHETKQKPDINWDIESHITTLYDFDADYISYFDTAFCIEVAEYWIDPLQALYNINNLLKDGGKLYISFHNIYPTHEPERFDSLRYTKAGVCRLLEKAQFKIIDIKPKTYYNWQYVKMLYDNEQMRGVGKNNSAIHQEQGWLITAKKI